MTPATPNTGKSVRIGKGRGSGLGLGVTVGIAWRAILGNPLRSALTALGVIIGVAAVMALTAIGAGSTANITRSLSSLGTNLLTISSGQGGGPPGLVRGGGNQTISLKDAEALREQFGGRVAGIAPALQRNNVQVKYQSNNTSATIIGTWPDYETVRNSAVASGSFFSESDVNGRRRTAVIGYQIAQDLFPGSDPVGERFQIAGVSFTVVGVLPDKGDSGFFSANNQILIPLSTFMQRVNQVQTSRGEPAVNAIYVQGPDTQSLEQLRNELTDFMAARHKIANPDDYDFNVQNQADALASVGQVTQTLTLFLGGIAGISLLVGGIGIMNIMLVSVTERTREIGIRKALGAKPRDILTQFLVESFVLSVGGGILGMLIGFLMAGSVGRLLNITPQFSPESIVMAFAFSALVGIFFGFYPASRAARLDPVESLRYE